MKFSGNRLELNFAASAAGGIKVELQSLDGKPVPGFELDSSSVVFGDALDRTVTWQNGADVSSLSGQPMRLRFVMQDADLYAYRFTA